MATSNTPATPATPVHLFDLLSALPQPLTTWSSNTIKIHLVINYKQIPYTYSYTTYADIAPLLSSLGVAPHAPETTNPAPYTLPAIAHASLTTETNSHGALMDSLPIALHLERAFPDTKTVFPNGDASAQLATRVQDLLRGVAVAGIGLILRNTIDILDPRGKEYFTKLWEAKLGKSADEMAPKSESELGDVLEAMGAAMRPVVELLRETEGVFFEGHEPGFADFVLVGSLVWFRRIDREGRLWGAVVGEEARRLWEGCEHLLDKRGEERAWAGDPVE
ncbi:hypothetical protein BJY01DRAFT_260627 [Aspergillus pseudoustus]|uniref:Glutathione S-transferase UstS-like C-terminal domain-containing protein n=1 Tax=Aspergillus pseudoustus TaxID=1810923 RepID=A0ABR4KJV9_9EURO